MLPSRQRKLCPGCSLQQWIGLFTIFIACNVMESSRRRKCTREKQADRIKLPSTVACWHEVLTLPMPLVENAAGRILMVASMVFLFRYDHSL